MTTYRIAIIEDDAPIVQMYRMKFESDGYEVETAGDGASGLKLIKSFRPQVVLLDLMMPVMDGVEMLTRLRKEPWGKNLKVIVLTNMGESEVPKSMRDLGVERFIVKADMTPKNVAEIVKTELSQ